MSSVGVDLSNTGDSIIRVQISTANIDKYMSASSIEKVTLNIGQTYNIKLTAGRNVKNTNYTPSSDGATLEISRYFL